MRREKKHLFIHDYLDAVAYRERGNVHGIVSLLCGCEILQPAN